MKCPGLKPSEDFAFKNKRLQIRHRVCRECQRKYAQDHYLKNREKYINNALSHSRANREQNGRLLEAYLAGAGCCKCGGKKELVISGNVRSYLHLRPLDFQELLQATTVICKACS